MEALSDDLIADGDLARALQRMMRRGDQDQHGDRMHGPAHLMERLNEQRQQQLDRYDMNSIWTTSRRSWRDQDRAQGIEQRMRNRDRRHARSAQDAGRPAGEGQHQSGSGSPASAAGSKASKVSGAARPAGPGQQGQRRAVRRARATTAGQAESGRRRPRPGDAAKTCSGCWRTARSASRNLDQLPEDPAGQIKELQRLRLHGPRGARRSSRSCWRCCKQQMMQHFFQGMQQAHAEHDARRHGSACARWYGPEPDAARDAPRAGAGLRAVHGQARPVLPRRREPGRS